MFYFCSATQTQDKINWDERDNSDFIDCGDVINRKTNQRVEEAKADSAEFAVLKETVDFLQQQLKDKEVRFAEQTGLVRELNSDVLRLTNEKAAIELELQKYKCVVPKCVNRQPQNGY